MKELERYLGATYSNICQPAIMAETPGALPKPEMPTIVTDTVSECPQNWLQDDLSWE